MMGSTFCLFFFFQAEDGIRDKLVTGVQTCALPICEFLDVAGELGDLPIALPEKLPHPFRSPARGKPRLLPVSTLVKLVVASGDEVLAAERAALQRTGGRLLAVRNTASHGFRHCWTPTQEETNKHSSAPVQQSGSRLGGKSGGNAGILCSWGTLGLSRISLLEIALAASFQSAVSSTY